MKRMWLAILWLAGLCAVLGFGVATNNSPALPSIHLVRLNDPVGMQGFDLKCTAAATVGAEPECFMTEVKASKTVQSTAVSLERARKLAAAFLGKMPAEKIYDPSKKNPANPPVADVLLVWNVSLGSKGAEGILKRNPSEEELDPALQRAVLLLESELGQDED